MIVLPSVNAGTRSSYGIEKKFRSSYGYSFNYGYNMGSYGDDPALAYFYSDVYLYYLKVDNKVIVNNQYNYIFTQDDFLQYAYYRNDGYGFGPVGCIDQLNSYLKNIYKINDFTFYPGGQVGVVLKSSIGRKMILTIYSYVYMEYDGNAVEERAIPWTFYINYPYDITDQTPSMIETVDFINPSWNGYTSYFDSIGGFIGWG